MSGAGRTGYDGVKTSFLWSLSDLDRFVPFLKEREQGEAQGRQRHDVKQAYGFAQIRGL